MAQQAQQAQQAQPVDGGPRPELNLLGQFVALLAEYGANATRNISEGFSSMTIQGWIRIVVIAGGWMLLRPYLQQVVTKGAVRKMEADDRKARGDEGELPYPELTPNEYRGIKEKLYAHDENDGAEGTGSDWGQKARVRQRQMLRELLEADERRRAAQDEDADIQEFLED